MLKALTSNISKKLIAFLVAAGVVTLNNKVGLNLDADTIYGVIGLAVAYIAGQSHVDAKKAISNAVNAAGGAIIGAATTTTGEPITTITKPPMSFEQVQPYVADVHKEINRLFEQIKSGKYTEGTQEAINVYMTLHEYLTKAEQAKGA